MFQRSSICTLPLFSIKIKSKNFIKVVIVVVVEWFRLKNLGKFFSVYKIHKFQEFLYLFYLFSHSSLYTYGIFESFFPEEKWNQHTQTHTNTHTHTVKLISFKGFVWFYLVFVSAKTNAIKLEIVGNQHKYLWLSYTDTFTNKYVFVAFC